MSLSNLPYLKCQNVHVIVISNLTCTYNYIPKEQGETDDRINQYVNNQYTKGIWTQSLLFTIVRRFASLTASLFSNLFTTFFSADRKLYLGRVDLKIRFSSITNGSYPYKDGTRCEKKSGLDSLHKRRQPKHRFYSSCFSAREELVCSKRTSSVSGSDGKGSLLLRNETRGWEKRLVTSSELRIGCEKLETWFILIQWVL